MTIKDSLRTMQRVLSASSKDKKPPFSQSGLTIPERDTLQMKIATRKTAALFSSIVGALETSFRYSQRVGTSRGELFKTLAGACLEEAKNKWRNSIESRLVLLG